MKKQKQKSKPRSGTPSKYAAVVKALRSLTLNAPQRLDTAKFAKKHNVTNLFIQGLKKLKVISSNGEGYKWNKDFDHKSALQIANMLIKHLSNDIYPKYPYVPGSKKYHSAPKKKQHQPKQRKNIERTGPGYLPAKKSDMLYLAKKFSQHGEYREAIRLIDKI